MTDNAPERIWANGLGVYGEYAGFGGTEYIRADLYTSAIAAALKRLDASLFTNAEHQQAKDILRKALSPVSNDN